MLNLKTSYNLSSAKTPHFTTDYFSSTNTTLSESDHDEGIPHLPNSSSYNSIQNPSKNIFEVDSKEIERPESYFGRKIRSFVPFKKPTNEVDNVLSTAGSENDSESDANSEDDCENEDLASPEEIKRAHEIYTGILKRAFYLTFEAKEAKHRAWISNYVLLRKLDRIIEEKYKSEDSEDGLFVQWEYRKEKTMRMSSYESLQRQPLTFRRVRTSNPERF